MLDIIVFLSGALVMVLEMVGGRVLAPHVGTSAIVWTSLIGVVLACLALGAWAGGKFADKKLSRQGLAQALAGAGAGCAITAFWHTAIGTGISSSVGNLYVGAVLAAICIFALPAFFFGMITPYVIRLRLAGLDTAGATVGRLYALSTAGSILGTFLGGFVLISFFSSTAILWGLTCSMFLLSLAAFPRKPWLRLILLVIAVFLAWQDLAYARWLVSKGGTRLVESPYNSIRIIEGTDNARGEKVRLMATDPGYTQSGMLIREPDELYFDYTRYYALGPEYALQAKTALMLGGGGYSVPKWLLSNKSPFAGNAGFRIKVVELDPAMTRVSKDFFELKDDPRMKIIHEDARAFLNRQTDKYDLVFVDVFNSYYSIPFQMGTKEAIKKMRDAVASDGLLMMNIISAVDGDDGRLFRSIYKNLADNFMAVRVYCVGQPDNPEKVQNLMVMAFANEPKSLAGVQVAGGISPTVRELREMEKHLHTREIADDVPALSDDFAPVERYTLMLTRR